MSCLFACLSVFWSIQLSTVEFCKSIVEPNADLFPRFKFQCRLSYGVRPSKHTGSDPKEFWLRSVMAITASVQPESARIVYTRSILCQIRHAASVSVPFFPKTAWIILRKTDLDPMWIVWSVFGQTHLVRKQVGMQETPGPVSGRMQPARYQFPAFRLGSVLPQISRTILCKTSPDPIWFWLTVSGFGQTDPVRKQANVQESSGPVLANGSQSTESCESDPACLLG